MAQSIQKKDGSTIDLAGGKIHVEAVNKRIVYFEKDSKKEQRVKFKDLKQASWDDFVFQTFEIAGKTRGYYVVAQQNGKSLLVSKRTRVKSRGGFESTYTHYEMAIVDAQSAMVDALEFTDENTDKKIGERAKIIPMIETHFAGCTKLIEKTRAFESPASDTQNKTILVLLNEPTLVKCL